MNNIDQDNLKEFKAIIGCDEVGRGPIAGPVVACAVKVKRSEKGLLSQLIKLNVTDSKKLSTKKRKIILNQLGIDVKNLKVNHLYKIKYFNLCFEFCLNECDHKKIDKINILQASLLAMKLASEKLGESQSKVLIDGNKLFETKYASEAIIKGDSKVVVIGLASIIAKEFRDEKMTQLDQKYPGYNLAKHAGYPTKEHRDAVKELGPSKIHRKTFKGVKEYL
ncbi:MAG: ribonuclease HII [Halobacteriovoraceae bacterium]|jgi:ribonuclease HII|nr:ribonuclease HII [Halobacteriovoraceae bacterium]